MSEWSISQLRARINRHESSSEEIVDDTRRRAEAADGEGARVFREQHYDAALTVARAFDRMRTEGANPWPLAGLPISIKDNIAVGGEISAAGSKVLLETAPALRDAPVVERLRRAGAAIVGRTNMSELAFTGVGFNPHFGTPANPFERAAGRIPGGSSAGAAISVTDRMAVAALGTDTGGSVRIPAALTGLVGFKPTQRRVPADGVVPLSPSLDCVGPLASSVADCALLDAIIANDDCADLTGADWRPRFWLPGAFMLEGCDSSVQRAFERALGALTRAGSAVEEINTDVFDFPQRMAARGTIATAEVWERFCPLLRARRSEFDPFIARRIERGASMSAADHVANLRERSAFIQAIDALCAPFDALIAPTVPIIAPLLSALADDGEFQRLNGLILRNPAIANLSDRPSISIPCHAPGEAPVGLMLIGHTMQDRRLLELGHFVERTLARAFGTL